METILSGILGTCAQLITEYQTKRKPSLFKKIAPHLTFMDYSALERQGADIQTKLDTMEKENIELKKIVQNMKSKTDRIDSSLEKIEKLKKKLGIR